MSGSLGTNFDQKCTNWCYLFTATDMMTQKLKKLGVLKAQDRLHPLSVAGLRFLIAGKIPSASRFTSGAPNDVIAAANSALSGGEFLCTEKALAGNEELQKLVFESGADTRSNQSRQGYLQKNDQSCPPRLSTIERSGAEAERIERQAWIQLLRAHCHVRAPALTWWNNFNPKIYKALERKETTSGTSSEQNDLGNTVDAALEKGTIAGILMDPTKITNPNRPLSSEAQGCRQEISARHGYSSMHWASVVAREEHGGTCEYLIRNSKGGDCTRYLHPEKCHNGNIWVPRSDLIGMIANVQFIQ